MTDESNREKQLFEQAFDLESTEERQRFLKTACGDDAVLRARIEGLLEADKAAEEFLPETLRVEPPERLPTEKPGDKIGRYKLLQQIGEGGCGVVYMAEQEEPVRRRVALKVIKLGMDTKQVIARFEAERQALALMDHPNIAKVLDAGATETGRPYFVMELVRGVKITEFCDENNITTADRLKLFIQVCQAIQHAHQKGVIHRDIKPSNILVTTNDGVPVPKVIDFGIAKATAGRLTDRTLFTAFDQFIGTPAYMSPEQAVMTSLDIDTRSDIYSLGVLLYELLTACTPFDQKALLGAGLDEMRRTIREKEPPKPSTRLTQALIAADLGKQTSGRPESSASSTRRLQERIHLLRGDLDWIVMKCLEKDRARRYETANGVAADIQRHLNHEPVVARSPSRWYEFQKTVRRHKFGFAAAAAVMLVLTLGIIGSTWQAIRATRAERAQARLRRDAETEKQRAETEASRSAQFAKFMGEMLEAAGPGVAQGQDATLLREILEKTATRIEKELAGQPEVQGDLWSTLGGTYADIGDHESAIKMFDQAVKCYRQVFTNHVKLALALGDLGFSQSFRDRVVEGTNNTAAGLAMARQLGDAKVLSISLENYGRSLNAWGKGTPNAEPYLREALAIRRELGTNKALVSALSGLAVSLTNAAEGAVLAQEALALSRQVNGEESPTTASKHFVLAQMLLKLGRTAEAEAEMHQALLLWRKVYDVKHPYRDILFRYYIESLARQGKWAEAKTQIQEEAVLTPTSDYCVTLRAAIQIRQGNWEAAIQILKPLMGALRGGPNINTISILALENSRAEFQKQSRRILDKTPPSPDYAAMERAAKAVLLLPPEESELKRATELADAVAQIRDNPGFAPWGSMTKALAEYRSGHFDSAVEWSDRTLTAPDVEPCCLATAHFIQALACGSSGKTNSAKAAFAAGEAILLEFRVGDDDTDGAILQNWRLKEDWLLRDWIIAEVLHREANALLKSQFPETVK